NHCHIVRDNVAGGTRVTTGRQVPFCLFTDPELARVGLSEWEARDRGVEYRLAKLPMADVLRTHTLSETRGFMKALVEKDGTGSSASRRSARKPGRSWPRSRWRWREGFRSRFCATRSSPTRPWRKDWAASSPGSPPDPGGPRTGAAARTGPADSPVGKTQWRRVPSHTPAGIRPGSGRRAPTAASAAAR